MRHTCLAAILTAALAGAAAANPFCDDLWFTRNSLMDRAGYCFASRLAQAHFDNAGCLGTEVTLDPATQAAVSYLRETEVRVGCKVDTAQTVLGMDDLMIRQRLVEQPLLDEIQGGCLGWTGQRQWLYAARDPASPMIGQVRPGDFVRQAHLPADGWLYVTTFGPNWYGLRSGGWLAAGNAPLPCADFAG